METVENDRTCKLGREVIETEAQMISHLIHRIDQNFAKACHLLHDCQGRIAVMGVGKSGHISKKIAATLASTGSPAFFVHPSEAKHGDMGMITKHDVVLAISNSGESEEIIAVLPFIKRLDVPLITLTGRPHSTLAQFATVNIDVSVEKEACPLGLAPTSSTTAALVMGDALAMVLLDLRGFTENDFALSHPGGALGRRLLIKVEDIMHQQKALPMVSLQASLKDALLMITEKKLGMTTVVNAEGKLAGIITDGDVRRVLENEVNIHTTTVENIMGHHPKTVLPGALAAEALALMQRFTITSLVIVNEDNQPAGIVHIHDILKAGIA